MTILEQIFFYLGPIVFALAGLSLATYISIKKARQQPLVCPMNGECEAVTTSRFSKFFGIPVERIGIVYYLLVIIVFSLNAAIPWFLPDEALFFMTGITVGAFVFSCYLVFIQAFVLKKWCTWCLFSAGFSTFIFITAVAGANFDIAFLLAKYKTIIIILHALGAAIGVGTATVTDIFFFRFLRDYRISASEHETMKILSNIIWFALGLIVITGIGLFVPDVARLSHSAKFLTKVVGVAVIIVNGAFLNLMVSPRLMEISFGGEHEHVGGELHVLRKLAFALGAISISSWYVVFVLGMLKSIPVSFGTGVSIYALIVFAAVVISQIVDRNMVHSFSKARALESAAKGPQNPPEEM